VEFAKTVLVRFYELLGYKRKLIALVWIKYVGYKVVAFGFKYSDVVAA
jgi:hypothetical protein